MAQPALQKLVFKTLLSLPTPILRLLSGGTGTWQGGRTLDPRLQFIAYNSRRGSSGASQVPTPDEARKSASTSLAMTLGAPEPGVTWEARTLDGPNGPIPCRLYRPKVLDGDAPVMVFAHFGGGVIGDLEICHPFCSMLARYGQGAVLSVDYRLAPEHRFPAGQEDVMAAYRWARDHAGELGARDGHVAIGGDSVGGNFAAVICQQLKAAGEPQPALQLLIYPWVDLASETASLTTYAESQPLTRGLLTWFAAHYLGPNADAADTRLSPLRNPDLSGLAPAVVVTAGFDPLVDQGELYARALKTAGVAVVYRCYDSLCHAFTAYTGAVPAADVACHEIAGLVREGYEGRIR